MLDLAFEEIGDGGEADVRMRPHVESLSWREQGRAHLVEENERADAAPAGVGQGAAHREAVAEIPRARDDERIEHIGENTTMPFTSALGDIGHVIQLAIAPVFLLTAIGTLLNVLSGRLGRAVDRRRTLTAAMADVDTRLSDTARGELAFVQRRVGIIYAAIALAVGSALLICLLIAIAFVDALTTFNFSRTVALLFVLSMLCLIGSLALFLREIYLGVNTIACPLR